MRLSFLLPAVLVLAIACDGASDTDVHTDTDVDTDTDTDTDSDTQAPNDPPTISATTPASPASGRIEVALLIADAQEDAVSLSVQWSSDGSTWQPATAGSVVAGLPTRTGGQAHSFFWNSAQDVFDNRQVQLRLVADDGQAPSEPAVTQPFEVQNAGVGVRGLRISELDLGEVDQVEVHNSTDAALSLGGYRLLWTDDEQGQDGSFTLPAFSLGAGERVLLREKSGTDTSTVLHLGGNINWSNDPGDAGGSVALVDADEHGIDFVRWGGSAAVWPNGTAWNEEEPLPLPTFHAVLSRIDDLDSQSTDDWCVGAPSPAEPHATCLQDGREAGLLLAEVSVDDPSDAFELVNTGTSAVDLTNWVAVEGPGEAHRLPPYLLEPGDRVWITEDEDEAERPGRLLWSELAAELDWAPDEPGSLALRDPLGNPIDFVRWGGSTDRAEAPDVWLEDEALPAPVVQGLVVVRTSETDTDKAADWCLGRPSPTGSAADCLSPASPGDVWINEIMVGVPDTVELTPGAASTVDLVGWRVVFDGGSARLPDGALLSSSVPYVTLDDDGTFTDAAPEFHTDVNIDWAQEAPGFAVLEDAFGNPIDFVRWGDSSRAVPAGLSFDGQAPEVWADTLSLSRQDVDSDSGDDFCIAGPTLLSDNEICE